jgi:hypothetical protein
MFIKTDSDVILLIYINTIVQKYSRYKNIGLTIEHYISVYNVTRFYGQKLKYKV